MLNPRASINQAIYDIRFVFRCARLQYTKTPKFYHGPHLRLLEYDLPPHHTTQHPVSPSLYVRIPYKYISLHIIPFKNAVFLRRYFIMYKSVLYLPFIITMMATRQATQQSVSPFFVGTPRFTHTQSFVTFFRVHFSVHHRSITVLLTFVGTEMCISPSHKNSNNIKNINCWYSLLPKRSKYITC